MGEDESAKTRRCIHDSTTARRSLRDVEDFFALSSPASDKRSDFAAEEHFFVAC